MARRFEASLAFDNIVIVNHGEPYEIEHTVPIQQHRFWACTEDVDHYGNIRVFLNKPINWDTPVHHFICKTGGQWRIFEKCGIGRPRQVDLADSWQQAINKVWFHTVDKWGD